MLFAIRRCQRSCHNVPSMLIATISPIPLVLSIIFLLELMEPHRCVRVTKEELGVVEAHQVPWTEIRAMGTQTSCTFHFPPFPLVLGIRVRSTLLHLSRARSSHRSIRVACMSLLAACLASISPPSEKKLPLVVSWVVDVDKEGSLREPQREGWPLHRGLGMPGASDGHVRAMQAHCRSSWTEAASQLPGGATWRLQGTTCRRGWP